MFGLEKLGYKMEIPPPEVDADLAIPAFKFDREKAAAEIKNLNHPLIADVKVVGSYLNLWLNYQQLAPVVLREVADKKGKYGYNDDGAKKTIIIEYSSPNIAKPMHIGHLRTTALGHSLSRIYEASGHKVIRANYLGDWGMQFGKILVAYQKWGDTEMLKKQGIYYLADLYTRITKEIETNPQLEEEARQSFKSLEKGDKELIRLWKEFKKISIKDFKKIYKILAIDFELWCGESDFTNFIDPIIEEALSKNVAQEEPGGPVVVDLPFDPGHSTELSRSPQGKLPSYLLKKSDGASLYSARDLANAKWRLQTYHPEKILYVAGHEQELYFKQIFKTLALMGYPAEKFRHISYGIVTLTGEKISTRTGHVVLLEELLKEAIKKAKKIKEVGTGAVIYSVLSQGNEKNISFDWKRALSLEGASAPYIQYAYVRAKGILDKAVKKGEFPIFNPQFSINEHEKKLIKYAAFYPEFVRRAYQLNQPHIIATYLSNLAQEFNRFYANCPVVTAENEVRNFRLSLTKAAAQVIENGLWLLGIQTPDKM